MLVKTCSSFFPRASPSARTAAVPSLAGTWAVLSKTTPESLASAESALKERRARAWIFICKISGQESNETRCAFLSKRLQTARNSNCEQQQSDKLLSARMDANLFSACTGKRCEEDTGKTTSRRNHWRSMHDACLRHRLHALPHLHTDEKKDAHDADQARDARSGIIRAPKNDRSYRKCEHTCR